MVWAGYRVKKMMLGDGFSRGQQRSCKKKQKTSVGEEEDDEGRDKLSRYMGKSPTPSKEITSFAFLVGRPRKRTLTTKH